MNYVFGFVCVIGDPLFCVTKPVVAARMVHRMFFFQQRISVERSSVCGSSSSSSSRPQHAQFSMIFLYIHGSGLPAAQFLHIWASEVPWSFFLRPQIGSQSIGAVFLILETQWALKRHHTILEHARIGNLTVQRLGYTKLMMQHL